MCVVHYGCKQEEEEAETCLGRPVGCSTVLFGPKGGQVQTDNPGQLQAASHIVTGPGQQGSLWTLLENVFKNLCLRLWLCPNGAGACNPTDIACYMHEQNH